MLFSHHSHSGEFCKHASDTLEMVVREAIDKGFTVYGLSEHCPRYRKEDLYPEEKTLSLNHLSRLFDDFLVEAHRLKGIYADRITLLVGLETEYITDEDLIALERLLDRHGDRIEYLVGSVHHVNTIPIDFDEPTFKKALESISDSDPLGGIFHSYFDMQYTLMQRFHPEVIGHFDLCRLYHPELKFQDYPAVWTKIERNVRCAVEYGALFELNAAAFRKGWEDAYPGSDIVQLIKSCNGKFTLSDDSHGTERVGSNYHRLKDYVIRHDLKELWYLKRGDKPNPAGRNLQPFLASCDWAKVDAWEALS